MPAWARHTLKLDPNNKEAMSSVGDDVDDLIPFFKFVGTIAGIDACVYGIHCLYQLIVKCDPINDTISGVGKYTTFGEKSYDFANAVEKDFGKRWVYLCAR